uniref:Endonuclease/exonuclease/phosphatase domain-containing protein n=1 Tax=Tetranychus urticae TaxID=32264 RepID=T1JYF3_TETUR
MSYCFSQYNLYKQQDLLWKTSKYLEKKHPDVKCVVCTQGIPKSIQVQMDQGYAAKMDEAANRSRKNRAAWKYRNVGNILTCFKRQFFPGYIDTFDTGRGDLLVAINVPDKAYYLFAAFGAAIGLQAGGRDAANNRKRAVDGIVLAGDFNIKNLYYGRGVNLKKPRATKPQTVLCYLLLASGLLPANFKDVDRGYEIDYLCTSRNFEYKGDIKLPKPNASDHTYYGAVFDLVEDLRHEALVHQTYSAEAFEVVRNHITAVRASNPVV